jgi:hypothetical protein
MKRRQALKIRKRMFLNFLSDNPRDLNYKQSTKEKTWDVYWNLPDRHNRVRTWMTKFFMKENKSCKHSNQ